MPDWFVGHHHVPSGVIQARDRFERARHGLPFFRRLHVIRAEHVEDAVAAG